MGLLSRIAPARGSAEAVHARVADGEHLWLAVRGARSLTLVRDDGPDIEVDTTPQSVGDETLLTAVVPLAAALADDAGTDVRLWLAHGRDQRPVTPAWTPRPSSPTVATPPTADRRWQLSVRAQDGRVVVRRTPVAPTVAVESIQALDDGVALRLDAAGGTVTVGGTELPVTDGVVVLGALPDLPRETNLPLACDGLAVVRARNVMERPQYATTMPSLPDAEVELRWLRDGRLALYRREQDR